MADLKDILFGISLEAIEGSREVPIANVAFDSRKVSKGSLFVAVKGLTVDGHDYVSQAIEKGAVSILCEHFPEELQGGVTYVLTKNSAEALGIAAANFYGNPSTKLKLVGVTGTNGKTTTATLLQNLFLKLGYKAGLISTVENKIGNKVLPSQFTTPDALQLNELLEEMVKAGCTHCFMEVSSHALVQHRVAGTTFAGGIFTNISHDHLDFHKTFDAYIEAKKMLFDGLGSEAFALVNVDDKRGSVMLQNTKASKNTFGIKSMSDFKGRILTDSMQGLQMDVDGREVWFKLVGEFNAYNLLTVYATAVLLGDEREEVLAALSSLEGARGRFELIPNSEGIIAIVDYAHTPDALENVLKTITQLRTKNEVLVTVVGCGGDRDKEKRPKMAQVATKFSDKVVLTSDNPRTEDPEEILQDMLKGVTKSDERKTMKIVDRMEAIKAACNLAGKDDIVLIAGKGHEDYQEINGKRLPFDDKEALKSILDQN